MTDNYKFTIPSVFNWDKKMLQFSNRNDFDKKYMPMTENIFSR